MGEGLSRDILLSSRLNIAFLEIIMCLHAFCNNDRSYGILCYDEYREFTGIMGDIRVFCYN